MPKRTAVDPTFLDLATRECINLRCRCGREVSIAPFKLIGAYGITQHTHIFSLKERFRCRKCKRRPPKDFWVAKWQD
jgi:hypothetical protein